ncbi:hypothetical protein [Streptomyces sp. NPDC055134]
MKRLDWRAVLVVVGLALLIGSAVARWMPGLIWGTGMVIGTVVATRRQDRHGSKDDLLG